MHSKRLKKKTIKKTAEATGDLIGNKIDDRITKVSNTSPQNISETVINEKERYIFPEERQKFIDDLRLI